MSTHMSAVLQNHGGEPVKSLEISKVTLDAVSRAGRQRLRRSHAFRQSVGTEYPDEQNGAC